MVLPAATGMIKELMRNARKGTLQFPGSSAGKEPTCNVGDPSLIPGSGKFPGEGIGYPLQYSCLENPHGQRSLVGSSPWAHKESDTTERLSTAHRKGTALEVDKIKHSILSYYSDMTLERDWEKEQT